MKPLHCKLYPTVYKCFAYLSRVNPNTSPGIVIDDSY
jgi:hypothetical protein